MSVTNPLWLAHEEGGEAHARSHPPAPRTACGEPALPERHTYPSTARGGRCAVCSAVIAAVQRNAARDRRGEAATA